MFELRIRNGDIATKEIIRILKHDIIPNLVVWEGYDKWQTIMDKDGVTVGHWRLTIPEN